MSLHTLRWPSLLGLILLAGISSAFGQIVTQPAGLAPGQQYRLVFVTDGFTNAESSSISTYNALALAQADTAPALVALNTTWTTMASTSAISAMANTATAGAGFPIYALNGNLVAANYTALWSGTLNNPINITETDVTANALQLAWTGSNDNGIGIAGSELGQSTPEVGQCSIATKGWSGFEGTSSVGASFSLYAMSGVLTATPEPGSATLLVTGLLAVAAQRRRRVRDPQVVR